MIKRLFSLLILCVWINLSIEGWHYCKVALLSIVRPSYTKYCQRQYFVTRLDISKWDERTTGFYTLFINAVSNPNIKMSEEECVELAFKLLPREITKRGDLNWKKRT